MIEVRNIIDNEIPAKLTTKLYTQSQHTRQSLFGREDEEENYKIKQVSEFFLGRGSYSVKL